MPNRIHVVDPYGTLGTMDANEARRAIQDSGFRLASEKEVTSAKNEEIYGKGAASAATAFGLGAARATTFGLSDEFLTNAGILSPEEISAYKEHRPGYSAAGEFTGVAGALLAPEAGLFGAAAAPVKGVAKLGTAVSKAVLPGAEKLAGAVAGEASPFINKILSQAGAVAAGSAIEGAAYGLGQTVSEHALGDPDLTAEKFASNVGHAALFGGALGALFGAAKGGLEARSAKLMAGADKSVTEAAANLAPESSRVSDAPYTGVTPTTYQEIADRVAAAKQQGKSIGLPEKQVLLEALGRVEMENPVNPLQIKSLEDESARLLYQSIKEMPGERGAVFRFDEAAQKQELVAKTEKAIADLAGKEQVTADAVEGGNKAIKAFTEQYQAEQEALKPIFKELKTRPLGSSEDVTAGIIQKMSDAVPGVAKMISIEGADLSVLPYKTVWGIDKATYNAVKEVVESLKTNPGDFESLRNIRRGLDQHVDVLAQGPAPAQIRALKASIMEFMQDAVQQASPDIAVRDAFKRWAINEQERQVIEKVFGASVGSPEFGAISKIKPELIGDRIFANTASVQAAKNILPPEQFNAILANWLSEAKAAATDKGFFSSNKFGSFLKKNQDALNVAFAEQPKALQHLHDITTIARILPDAPSINPSGTAKTLISAIKHMMEGGEFSFEHMLSMIPKKLLEKLNAEKTFAQLEAELAGKSAAADSLSVLERTASKTTKNIQKGIAAIFSEKTLGAAKSGLMAIPHEEKKKDHDKNAELLNEVSNDPQKLIDVVHNATLPLSTIAPQTAAGLQMTMGRAAQFLGSKVPKGTQSKPLSPKYQPSKTEIAKFHNYFSIVEDPTKALYQVAAGSIIPETMETLTAVYPKLLADMQLQVMDELSGHIAKKKDLPYRRKLALSMFVGMDLVDSLDPASMLTSQGVLSSASRAKQEQERMQGTSAKPSGADKLTQSNRFLTASQASAQRREA